MFLALHLFSEKNNFLGFLNKRKFSYNQTNQEKNF